LAEHLRIKRFIFASSIEAMGPVPQEELPAAESLPCAPVSNYGFSKLRAEQELNRLATRLEIQLAILRFANVYDHSESSFPRIFYRGLSSDDPLRRFYPVYRDFVIHPVHVSDCVDAIQKACATTEIGVFNVAGPRYYRIGEIADIISRHWDVSLPRGNCSRWENQRIRIRVLMHRWRHRADLLTYWTSGRPPHVHRGYSTEAAQSAIQFFPKTRFEEGITPPSSRGLALP
jgi:nucleoside-diphosphate-sugar epimerase